jgi:stage II sporulation protein D
MAQAIAARNFAFYKMINRDTSNFDVYSDTRDQVYSGMEKYKPLADSAITLTSGMIVEYDGQPARCFFHSICGGHTENVQHVWQGQPALPYLSGVSDIDSATGLAFCAASPQFYWTTTYTLSQLDRMAKTNLALANPTYATRRINPDVTDIEVMDRFDSSRIDSLEITARDGSVYFVRGDRIRYFFKNSGGTILRSSLFKIDISRDVDGNIKKIILKGQGSGHGVGMCQWGALGMSRLGYSYLQILLHYYPGTEVKKVY